jgi:tetratricopeptide (TPR) repeat protein
MERLSTYDLLGIPEALGITLSLFLIILALTPYLGGMDFGVFKVPQIKKRNLRIGLKIIGPILIVLSIGPFFKLWPAHDLKLEPFKDGKFGLLIAGFEVKSKDQENRGKEIQGTIESTLNARIVEEGIIDAIVREIPISIIPKIDSHEQAREIGKKYNAEIVIWGDITLKGVIPYLTIVNSRSEYCRIIPHDTVLLTETLTHKALANINDMRLPALTDAPTLLAIFSTGLKFYFDGRHKMALKYFDRCLSINYGDIDTTPILIYIGNIYSLTKQSIAAISIYSEVLKINPMIAEAYSNRGSALQDEGKDDQAIADYTKALEINPKFVEAYNNRANIFSEKGEYNRAIADYNKALEANPNLPIVLNNRGNTWALDGKHTQAISDFNKSLEINANFAPAYYNRGKLWRLKGKDDQAIADYTKALEINPKFVEAYNNRANIFSEKGEYNRAIADYDKGLQINQNYFELYFNRGNVLSGIGEYSRAISDYSKALEINPNYVMIYNNYGWLLATCSDVKYRDGLKAVKLAQKAVKMNENYMTLDTLAAAYAEAGRFNDAIRKQEKAIALLKEEDSKTEINYYIERLEYYKAHKPWKE